MVYAPLLFYAGFLGFTSLIAGSVAAHGLNGYTSNQRETFKLAAHYQMMHGMVTVAAVALSEALRPTNVNAAKWIDIAAWLLAAGTSFFSFTIYATTLGAPSVLGPLTPFGGLLMMAGWCTAMLSAFVL